MLNMFAFERVAVVLGDLYFVDPNPRPGQEGAERGVRIELRRIEAGDLEGSIYSARPITIGAPMWRIDLLETAAGPVGTFDRTHHHPRFSGWEPSERVFVPELSTDPLEWLGDRLRDVRSVLSDARVEPSALGPDDAEAISAAASDIVDCVRRQLDLVHEGRLARVPERDVQEARISWL
jgi:hypothetical protein